MPARRQVAGINCPLDQAIDDLPVLAVHHDQRIE